MNAIRHSKDGPVPETELHTRPAATATWILWGYLLLITLAELLTSLGQPQAGLLLHLLILIGLITNTVVGLTDSAHPFALALTLGPLIRILSLGLPLRSVPQIAWYPLVSVPLLLATWIVMRQTGVSRRAVGLRRSNLLLELLLIGGGLGLGALEYMILQPSVTVPALTWQALLVPALSLLIFTGFTEEVIFRGLIQTLALPVLGRWALLYVSTLFAVLHIGYLSVTDVAFVFAVGLLFAYIKYWSGSIFGLTFAHGLTNIMLFLVLPYLAAYPAHPLARVMPWAIWGGTALSLVAIGRLWWGARLGVRTHPAPLDADRLRRSLIGFRPRQIIVACLTVALVFPIGAFLMYGQKELARETETIVPSGILATPTTQIRLAAAVPVTPTSQVTTASNTVASTSTSQAASPTFVPSPAATPLPTITPTQMPAIVVEPIPESIQVLMARAQWYRQQGDYDRAIWETGAAVAVAPADVGVLLSRARLYVLKNDPAMALADLHLVLSLAPDNLEALTERARIYKAQGQLEAALADLNTVLATRQDDAGLYMTRAAVLRGLGQYQAAQADLQTASAIRPNDPAIMVSEGATLEKLGRSEEALELYSRALDGSTERDVLYLRIANIRYGWEQYDRALANFQVALALNPRNGLAYLGIGLAQRKLGNDVAAIAAFKEYLRLVPNAPGRTAIEVWSRKHGG